MQYGVCGGRDVAEVAADAGYEYVELSVGGVLKPLEGETAFREALDEVKAFPLPCPVLNCFVPGDIKITGPDVEVETLRTFVTTACERAKAAGVEVIVFGSGGARRIPGGFRRDEAHGQLLAFCKMLGPVAATHSVTIAIEPLNATECNVLNTVGECADLVRETDHPAIRLLVDGYHWLKDGDSAEAVVEGGPLFAHTHVATIPNRLPPGGEECDLASFFRALVESGYDGRVSIEGKIPNPREDLPKALSLMKKLCAS